MKKSISLKISLAILLLLGSTACKKVHQIPPQHNTDRMLQVELRMPEAWQRIVIGPKNTTEYPIVPHTFSMFMTGESTGALKPCRIIEDSKGTDYSILLAMVTGNYSGGGNLSTTLKHSDKTSHNEPGVFPLNNVKPPIKIKGFFFWCRKPLPDTTLYIGNLRFDDTVIEDFSNDSKWRVIDTQGKGSRFLVSLFAGALPGLAMAGFTIPEPFPEREGSLTSNSSFEKDEVNKRG